MTNPNGLNNLSRGSPKEHFCKLILKSVQWFRIRRFLKVFYIDYIGKISPAPWRPCFLTNPNVLNNLGRGSPKEHFCKIIWKSVQWFWTRRFLKFSIQIYRENKPRPLVALFFDESKWLEQSCNRITKGTFLLNYIEIGPVVSDKKIFKSFLYRLYRENKPRPLAAMFLINPNVLNNFGRGSPKEHFCEIILKSVQWFRTRRFLNFSI